MILKKVFASYYFIKGKKKLNKSNDIEALEYFKKAIKYEKEYDILIYKGFAEFSLSSYEDSIMSYQLALQLIESNEKLNFDEKNYLTKYILDDLIKALELLGKINDSLYKYKNIYKNLKFNIKNININILDDFPNV